MFCHEGPWHKVDRIWTIHTDGSGLALVHKRTMNMEIAGHEFWAPDGKTIWYDLQTPRGQVFWLAGYEVATGKRRWYNLDRNLWSVHFNIAPDQKSFSGDGGDSEMVAHAPDGKWLYILHPHDIPDVAGIHAPGSDQLISPGTLDGRLVDKRHDAVRREPARGKDAMRTLTRELFRQGAWVVLAVGLASALQVWAIHAVGMREPFAPLPFYVGVAAAAWLTS